MTRLKLEKGSIGWLGIILVTVFLISIKSQISWVESFPEKLFIPFDILLNIIMDFMVEHLGWFFMSVSWLLEWPIKGKIVTPINAVGCYQLCVLLCRIHCIRLATYLFCRSFMRLHGNHRLLVREHEHSLSCCDIRSNGCCSWV